MKRYITRASPLALDGQVNGPYDLLAAWEAMPLMHAKERFDTMRLHQKRCLQLCDEEVSHVMLQQKLHDKVVAWLARRGYNDEGITKAMTHQATEFVNNLIRLERPKVQSRIDNEAKTRTGCAGCP